MMFMVRKFLESFMKKINKERKKKGNKLYMKWKCYDNSFNSWID